MTAVKICGLTGLDAAVAALEAGADMLGFVFAAGRRQLRPQDAAALLRQCREHFDTLPDDGGRCGVAGVQRSWRAVGVFANQPLEFVRRTAREVGLDLVQLSGSESAGYCRSLGIPFIRTLHLSSGRVGLADGLSSGGSTSEEFATELRRHWAESGATRLLLDSGSPGRWGGTGETFAWERVAGAAGECLVAGGLTPNNVSRAISILHPWGVDVSSGVETAGRKDPELIRQFVTEVKRSDHHVSEL